MELVDVLPFLLEIDDEISKLTAKKHTSASTADLKSAAICRSNARLERLPRGVNRNGENEQANGLQPGGHALRARRTFYRLASEIRRT